MCERECVRKGLFSCHRSPLPSLVMEFLYFSCSSFARIFSPPSESVLFLCWCITILFRQIFSACYWRESITGGREREQDTRKELIVTSFVVFFFLPSPKISPENLWKQTKSQEKHRKNKQTILFSSEEKDE